MESENETVQLPQTSLGMHNLMIDLVFELGHVVGGFQNWDLDPDNLEHMAAATKIIKDISKYCAFDKEYADAKERIPEMIDTIDKAYSGGEED
jgi:hypothetical protein|nr:MAG TPA: hypothetical protein [Caudoviricetes sp.]